MSEDFKVSLGATLDTSDVEKKLKEYENRKVKIKFETDTNSTDNGIQVVNQSIKTTRSTATSFGDTLKRALNIGSSAAVVAKGFHLIHTAARNARTAIKDIDSAITDLRLATGDNYASAAKMVTEYNGMGKALGATTKEVSDSAVTWLRQGKSAEEAGVLIRDALILSKVGMLDSAEAAKALTSSMKGYGVGVNDAIRIIDKLTAVDANAAVNAGGLAQAMSQTAVTANMAGVSMDKLIGYLAVVGEVTQRDMSSVGTMFKTFFSRMSNIKAGKLEFIDEDGTAESLSDVETILNNMGIKLREDNNEFRNFGDVLDDVGAAWSTYSSVQQAAISKAMAGVRNQEGFRVLMENYDAATKYMDVAANSAGTAEKKFSAYLDSIEAKTKSLQAAFESLAVNSVSTETFGGIIDATTALVEFADKTNLVKGTLAGIATAGAIKGFTALATGITSATARFQEFNTALQLLKAGNIGEAQISQLATLTANLSASQLKAVLSSKALSVEQRMAILTASGMGTAEAKAALETMGLAAAEGAATGTTVGLSSALKGLWATLAANPLTAVFLAVTAGVAIYSTFSQKAEEARQKSLDAAKAAREQTNKIRDLYGAYQDANKAYADSTGSKEDLTSATDALLSALGIEASAIDELAGKYGDLDTAINEVTADALRNERMALVSGLKTAQNDLMRAANLSDDVYFSGFGANNKTLIDALKAQGFDITGTAANQFISLAGNRNTYDGVIAMYNDIARARKAMQEAADEAGMSAADMMETSVWKSLDREYSRLDELVQTSYERINDLNQNIAQELFVRGNYEIPESTEAYSGLRDSLVEVTMANADFVGSQEDAEAAVDSFLSTLPGFESYAADVTDSMETATEGAKAFTEAIAKAKEYGEALSSAVSESLSSTGMSDDAINSITNLYSSLEGFDADRLFQNTTSGVHMNAEALAELNDEYVRLQKLEIDNTLDVLKKKYNDLQTDIAKAELEGRDFQEGLAELYGIEQQIDATERLRSQYAALTSEYNQFLAAQSAGDARDPYGNMAKSYDSVKQLIEQGWVNDAEVNEYLDTIYGKANRSGDNVADFDRLTQTIEGTNHALTDFFSLDGSEITSDGVFNFLDTVHELLGDDFVQVAEDGSYAFDFMGQKINTVADKLGVSVEFIQLMEQAMQDAGFDVFFDSLLSDIDFVARTAQESADNLKELGLTELDFNLSSTDIGELNAQLTEAESILNSLRNADGEIDISTPGAKDALILTKDLSNKIAELQVTDIEIPVELSETEFAQGVLLIQDSIKRLCAINAEIEARLAIGGDVGELEAERDAILSDLSGSSVAADLELNTSSADAAVQSWEKQTPTIQAKMNVTQTGDTSVQAKNATSTVTYQKNSSAVDSYKPQDKRATVYYNVNSGAVTAFLSRNLNKSATITYTYRTVGSAPRGARAEGTAHVNGTAFAGGSSYGARGVAFRNGDWGTKDSGVALGGELGAELLVRNGKWQLIGENSAEFFRYRKGDIIFNAAQTKQIFDKGKITNGQRRGDALVSGTAFDTGSGGKRRTSLADINRSVSNVSATSSSAKGGVGLDADKEKYDWIKILLDRVERKIKTLSNTSESAFLKLNTRLSSSKEAISEITKQLDNQQKAYTRYMAEANSINISSTLKKSVRDGTIDISLYDKETANLIKQYEEWYTAAIDCRDAIDELHESLGKLYQDQFNNRKNDFENQLNLVTQRMDLANNDIALIQAKGYMETTKHYADLAKMQENSIATMRKELSDLQGALSKAVSSGEIEMYSDAYYEMQSAIGGVKNSIAEATVKLQEYQNTMRELEWSYFDFAQDRFSQLPKEADFLIRLMSNAPLFDDNGKANKDGMATLGLHALNYNAYMEQANEYAKEAQKIQKELAKDPLNTDLIKRREQLLALQQQSVLAAEDEKNAVKDLVEQGINLELDSLKELIDAYEDSVDRAKDLHDYQKKLADKTSDVAATQKMLAAYAGDTSEENRARVQKLQKQLEKAQDDLQETEYQQYIKDQKALLSDLYDDYEATINARLDDVNALMSDMIATTNVNASEISRTIREVSADVGYRVSDSMKAVFAGDGWNSAPVNQVISGIYEMIAAMLGKSGSIKAFASGGLADFTGLAKLDGTPSKPELVLNPNETERFLALRDTLKGIDLSALKSVPYMTMLESKDSRYRDRMRDVANRNTTVNSGVTIGDIHFNIDHVQDYNDFMRQAQRDPKFEKLIHTITDNEYMGGSKLKKYSINF